MAEELDELARLVERVGVGGGDDVHDTGPAAVRLRAAEALHVDVLAGDAAHYIRTGDEDAALLGQDHQVGQRWPVRGAARRGAEDDGDLRHLAGGPGHGGENHADRVQARDAFEDPGAARMPQAHDRRADLQRVLVRRNDRLAACDAHGAALDARVAGERDGGNAADAARARHHSAVVCRKQQLQRAGVEQRLKARLRVAPWAGCTHRSGWPGRRDLRRRGHSYPPADRSVGTRAGLRSVLPCWLCPGIHDGHVDLLWGDGGVLLWGYARHTRQ